MKPEDGDIITKPCGNHRGWALAVSDGPAPKHEFWAVKNNEWINLDVSPYKDLDWLSFTRIVDLDFPRRIDIGPLTTEQIELLWLRMRVIELAAA